MTKNREGLINVSSIGGMMYLFNVPYGVGKAACDRMAGKEIRTSVRNWIIPDLKGFNQIWND